MPHLLIAGATGSGKSVCINTIIMSILYKANPEDVKFIMIDPKVVELSVYNGIPHLMIPVVTDPKKAAGALQWAVNEMMDRYKKFADAHVRDMKGYNDKIVDGKMEIINNGEKLTINVKKMPQIVVVVDELADLMMVASKEVEESICRLAQLARAAGIHLIIATQRPSVNVITGLIKANMPSRIAFAVTSGVDSRTILDMVGAERLLGKGDMLYYPQGIPKPLRVQGAFVTDKDVMKVTSFIRENNKPDGNTVEENQRIMEAVESASSSSDCTSIDSSDGGLNNDRDEYFADAARLLIEKDKGSIGMLQRNFKIGFNRAARIIDQLEEFGVVGPEVGTKPRKILVNLEEFESMLTNEGGAR
jgi:S-DNA-T family DNA segregation ATPase FtsK/SpoIIIE